MRLFLFLAALMLYPSLTMARTALFAGGCFWCMESEFKGIEGIESVVSGYAGGDQKTANYADVSSGKTDHREVVQVTYDPGRVSYEKLLEIFWDNVDPFDEDGQFCDKGFQYTAAIYVHDAAERRLAEESVARISKKHGKPVATAIVDSVSFYLAEEYHQDYAQKNKRAYARYKLGCGRNKRLEQLR